MHKYLIGFICGAMSLTAVHAQQPASQPDDVATIVGGKIGQLVIENANLISQNAALKKQLADLAKQLEQAAKKEPAPEQQEQK